MNFGIRLAQVRNDKKMSQDALAKALDTTATMISRYERDEVKPSIEVAARIASILEVSLDFLVGNSDNAVMDAVMVKRINQVQALSIKEREIVFALFDAFLRDSHLKRIYK